jgi:predicted TIM-barrel fold metal-dependent hydrolase
MGASWMVGLALGLVVGSAAGQVGGGVERDIGLGVDPGIARVIAGTGAIDNHAHPVLPPPNDGTDRGFDALPVDNMEAQTDIVAWRADNPQLDDAWRALWGFAGTAPLDADGMKRLAAARAVVKAREGTRFDEWVLGRAGIEVMLANRVAMGDGVQPPRFRWVPYVDALLFPLDTAGLAAGSPDRRLFFPMEDRLRARYLSEAHLAAMPKDLAGYLAKVVTPTLERQRAGGAVAEKFEIAYLRGFDFADVSEAEAAAVYGRWVGKTGVSEAEYKVLEDFLFRYIAGECGRLGMAVHLHTMSGGGGYFHVGGANPMLLEPLFNDARLRKTKFVMLHGGWPFVREAGALLQKPNVYLDLSQESLSFPARTLSGWLREWLETFPEKVLFGTDGYPYSDALGWEESTWIAARNGRTALGLALTGMMRDGEITRERADQIARMVMRGNAEGLYGLR